MIIDFYPTVKSDEKRMVLDRENQLKPLQANHELFGFEVTLVEGLSGMSLIDYAAISGRLRINEVRNIFFLRKCCLSLLSPQLRKNIKEIKKVNRIIFDIDAQN